MIPKFKKSKHNPIIKHYGFTKFDPFIFKDTGCFILFYSNRESNSIESVKTKDFVHYYDYQTVLKSKNRNTNINRCSYLEVGVCSFLFYTKQEKQRSVICYRKTNKGGSFENAKENVVITPDLPHEKQSVMNPFVLFEDNTFKMWYSAGDYYEPNCICYAESDTKLIFKKIIHPVLVPSRAKYENNRVGGGEVMIFKNKYILFYIGYKNINKGSICIAMSNDGINWRKYKKNPVIKSSIFGWDSDSVYKSTCTIFKGDAYLLYNGRKKEKETIGLAISKKFEIVDSDFN